jgi:hypothetical protein
MRTVAGVADPMETTLACKQRTTDDPARLALGASTRFALRAAVEEILSSFGGLMSEIRDELEHPAWSIANQDRCDLQW